MEAGSPGFDLPQAYQYIEEVPRWAFPSYTQAPPALGALRGAFQAKHIGKQSTKEDELVFDIGAHVENLGITFFRSRYGS